MKKWAIKFIGTYDSKGVSFEQSKTCANALECLTFAVLRLSDWKLNEHPEWAHMPFVIEICPLEDAGLNGKPPTIIYRE